MAPFFIEEWCTLAFCNVIALVHIYLLTGLLSGPKQPYTVLVFGITEPDFLIIHCALASCGAVYCNRSCLWVCDIGRAGGVRTFLQPARAQCLRLSERFFHLFVHVPILLCFLGQLSHLPYSSWR